MTDPDSWRSRAACLSTDAELFFTDSGAGHLDAIRRAKRVCAGCPVRRRCLDDALAVEEGRAANNRFGVWGGLTPAERYQVERCRSGICVHPQHEPTTDYARMVRTIAEMAAQGMSDYQIAKRVHRRADTVFSIRKEHGIRAGHLRGSKS